MLERLYSHSEDDAGDDEEDEEEDEEDEDGNGEEACSSLGGVPLFLLEDFGIAAAKGVSMIGCNGIVE